MKYNDLELYTGMYEATEEGHIYSHYSNKILKEHVNKGGYHTVSLVNKYTRKRTTTMVHRFIAYCLVDGYEEGLQVNHIDGNKSNNTPSNLEWVTPKENVYHASRITKVRDFRGENNPRYGVALDEKTKEKISKSLKNNPEVGTATAIPVKGTHIKSKEVVYYESASKAGKELNIDNSAISKVLRGTRKSAGGYRWEKNSK